MQIIMNIKNFREWQLFESFEFDDSNPRQMQHGYDPVEGWKEDLIKVLKSDQFIIDKELFIERFVGEDLGNDPIEIKEAESAWNKISELFAGSTVRILSGDDGVSFDGIYKTFQYSRGIKGYDISHNIYTWSPRMLDLGDGTSIMWITLGITTGTSGISMALISDDSADDLIDALNKQ